MKDIKEKHMCKLREELAEEIEEFKRDQQAKADAGKPRLTLVPTEIIRNICMFCSCPRCGNGMFVWEGRRDEQKR